MVTKPLEGVESPQSQLSGVELAYLVQRVAQYSVNKGRNNNIQLISDTSDLDILIGQMEFGMIPPPEVIARAIRAEIKNKVLKERDRFSQNITEIIKTARNEPEFPDYTNLLADRGPWNKDGNRRYEWMGLDDAGRRILKESDLRLEKKIPGLGDETILSWPPGSNVNPLMPLSQDPHSAEESSMIPPKYEYVKKENPYTPVYRDKDGNGHPDMESVRQANAEIHRRNKIL